MAALTNLQASLVEYWWNSRTDEEGASLLKTHGMSCESWYLWDATDPIMGDTVATMESPDEGTVWVNPTRPLAKAVADHLELLGATVVAETSF